MALFLKILEWKDDSKDTIVYKLPLEKSGKEVNQKSKLIVRESQQAIFVHKGKICDVFSAGTYDLNTEIFPILSKLTGWKYGFETPITCDIYFINTKQFTSCKWGTANPIIKRDPEFGPVRVKGFGSYSFKVDDGAIFLKELFGTNSSFKTNDITDWLKTMLISCLTDCIGESKVSILDLAGNTSELNKLVSDNIQQKFNDIGLKLVNLFIENMSVPSEIEKTIDERTKLGILGDKTDTMMKIAAAEALKDVAKNPGGAGNFVGAGMGLGAGVGLGGIFADAMKSANQPSNDKSLNTITCSACGKQVPSGSKFCPECGAKLNLKKFCPECGGEISENSKFCPNCGKKL